MNRMTVREAGREFLARRRFALVGASREEKSFSRYVLRELLRRGYEVVPVNPAVAELDGRRCFPRVQDVTPPVDAALIMTPPARSGDAVVDCLAAGVRSLPPDARGGRALPGRRSRADHGHVPVHGPARRRLVPSAARSAARRESAPSRRLNVDARWPFAFRPAGWVRNIRTPGEHGLARTATVGMAFFCSSGGGGAPVLATTPIVAGAGVQAARR
jgi:predicted CoA-binding protein